MNRKQFLGSFASLPVALGLGSLNKWFTASVNTMPKSDTMPVIFVGHGSPMNGIEVNEFSNSWRKLGQTLPRPKMVLCISAHWLTKGSYVTAMSSPPTIHDFGGFPPELFAVQYKAPGSPYFANLVKETITSASIGMDHDWGLDHGCWTVVRHMYPDADIPVLQMSIDFSKDASYQYNLARDLQSLRNKGILIMASGNMVHNLRMIAYDKINEPDYGYDWALQANSEMKMHILNGDHQALIDYDKQGNSWKLAIPSADHYFPLLYALGLKNGKDQIEIFNDKAAMGSVTMTSVLLTQG